MLQAQLATCTIELRNASHQLQTVEAEVQRSKSQLAAALIQRDEAKAHAAELAAAAEQHALLNRQLQESHIAHSAAYERCAPSSPGSLEQGLLNPWEALSSRVSTLRYSSS